MSLKTRLDGRSKENDSFKVINKNGDVLAEVKVIDQTKATLEINTIDGLHIQKPNGWESK